MKITIWDMDFFYKKTFYPNPLAMKISSFHKQQHHIVNFVTEKEHINLSFDKYYIFREKRITPKPPGNLLDDRRVKCIGAQCKFFDCYYEPPEIISSVRPDYLLYPEKEKDAYYNAEIIQFFHKGKLLKKIQPFENTKSHHKKTLIVDKEFWSASKDDIVFCLNQLKESKNIAFQYPIDLSKLIGDITIQNSFAALHFSPGTIFKFRNTYGFSREQAFEIFKFIMRLRQENKHVRFGFIPFKAVTKDHYESVENGMYDLERCFQIMDMSKKYKIPVRIISPKNRFESPFWYYFETFEYWSLYLSNQSYIEMMLHGILKRKGGTWYNILNNPINWITPNTYFLLKLLLKRPDLADKYFYRKEGENFLPKQFIDWDIIKKYMGHIENETKQEELKRCQE